MVVAAAAAAATAAADDNCGFGISIGVSSLILKQPSWPGKQIMAKNQWQLKVKTKISFQKSPAEQSKNKHLILQNPCRIKASYSLFIDWNNYEVLSEEVHILGPCFDTSMSFFR